MNLRLALFTGLASLGLAVAADATVIQGSSSAFDIFVELTSPTATTGGPIAQVGGTAPPAYALNDNAVNLAVPAQDTIITADSSDVNASSDVDGGSGVRNAAADATVLNAASDLTVVVPDLLELMALQIYSDASVSGDFGALSAIGSTTLIDASVTLFNNPIPIQLNPNGVNDEVVNLGGIRIVLNEHILSGDGSGDSSIIVNAIHIYFENAGNPLNPVNGEIILSQSRAALVAVPEPGSAALLALGFIGMAVRQRARA